VNLILFRSLQENYSLNSSDPRHRHIVSVLRAGRGDTLRIGVVDGPEGVGTVVDTDRTGTVIRAQWTHSRKSALPLDVLVGHPRPPVLQRLWRDLATARVRSVHIFAGDLGEPNYLGSSVWDKLEERLLEGMSQGHHTARPDVYRYARLDETLKAMSPVLEDGEYRYYGGLGGDAVPLAAALIDMLNHRNGARDERGDISVSVCIGPERGLSPRETDILETRGFRGMSLGDSVYRTESAVHGMVIPFASVLCGPSVTKKLHCPYG